MLNKRKKTGNRCKLCGGAVQDTQECKMNLCVDTIYITTYVYDNYNVFDLFVLDPRVKTREQNYENHGVACYIVELKIKKYLYL